MWLRDHLPPDCNSTREKFPERYLHLGVGARRRHEIATACRVFGAHHLVDVRRGPRPNEDPLAVVYSDHC
eukprot:3537311-Prymnesium_polylepis.1